jgi:hypothetical protein
VDPAVFDRIRAAMADQLPPFTADMAPGLVPNVMTGRIANRLDLRGPNYIIDAACSSAHLAVQAAMIELRAGRSDMMLAGGVNASISAEVYMVFNQLGALAGSGQVRPFSEGGDGTLMGEGLGILALKRLEDALDAGDRVYAVLKGIGQSSDGKGSGILAPRMEGEMLAIERAMLDAGQDPAHPDIPGLIECHGTGIPLGDKTEVGALKGMFGARAANGLPLTAIGSVKSMIGHCIPAAGAAGLIKTALALYHKTLPPTLSDKIRTGLPVDETGLYVNTEARPWIAAPGVDGRALAPRCRQRLRLWRDQRPCGAGRGPHPGRRADPRPLGRGVGASVRRHPREPRRPGAGLPRPYRAARPGTALCPCPVGRDPCGHRPRPSGPDGAQPRRPHRQARQGRRAADGRQTHLPPALGRGRGLCADGGQAGLPVPRRRGAIPRDAERDPHRLPRGAGLVRLLGRALSGARDAALGQRVPAAHDARPCPRQGAE